MAGALGVEIVHWRASRRHLPPPDRRPPVTPLNEPDHTDHAVEALIVLGFSATAATLHPMARWRCAIAARTRDPRRRGIVVFSGRGRSRLAEAEMMSTYACDVLGLPRDEVLVESTSMTTWENLVHSLPLVEDAEVIRVVSAPVHAARARRYVHELRPDLAARLAPADDYRFGEHLWMKVECVAYEWLLAARQLLVGADPSIRQGRELGGRQR